MPKITDLIKEATDILKQSGVAKPRKEANSLLTITLKKDRTFLIAHAEYELTEAEHIQFMGFVERRSKREPFQHIAGKQEFWGLDFIVSRNVLVPRPETELIVEDSIKTLQNLESPTFCEIGVGSGCISISILNDVQKARAFGVDISEDALQIAEQNAILNKVADRLELKKSDVFKDSFENKVFDLIVSNPPYIPQASIPTLQQEVRDFDPHIALTDGKDGISIIKNIIDNSPKHLTTDGLLLIEIGFDQSDKVKNMFDPSIWRTVEFLPDLQGIPRIVKSQLN